MVRERAATNRVAASYPCWDYVLTRSPNVDSTVVEWWCHLNHICNCDCSDCNDTRSSSRRGAIRITSSACRGYDMDACLCELREKQVVVMVVGKKEKQPTATTALSTAILALPPIDMQTTAGRPVDACVDFIQLMPEILFRQAINYKYFVLDCAEMAIHVADRARPTWRLDLGFKGTNIWPSPCITEYLHCNNICCFRNAKLSAGSTSSNRPVSLWENEKRSRRENLRAMCAMAIAIGWSVSTKGGAPSCASTKIVLTWLRTRCLK